MHRFRSWILDPPEYRSQRNRLLPIEGGDGSTLNLDFTTGVLDPRLKLTRDSNATFINSSGLVQYADANLVFDTGIVSAPTLPWNPFTATGGSNTLSNGVVVSASGSSGRAFYRQTLSNLAIGLQYSFAVEITAQSGGETYAQSVLPAAAGVTGSAQYYVNGSLRNSGDAIETGLVCVVWTAAATSIEIRIGVGANGASGNKSVTWTKPRAVPGNIAQPAYFANSSTTAAYQAPRFDYDPTSIGTPRGLLIEGQSQNLFTYSENFTDSLWSKIGSTIDTTSVIGPDGVAATTRRVKENSSTDQHGLRKQFTCAGNTTYTMSVFVKKGSYNSFVFEFWGGASFNAKIVESNIDGSTQPTATSSNPSGVNPSATKTSFPQTGWHRYTLTFTNPNATGTLADFNVLLKESNAYLGNGTNYMDVYGFSLELGTAASSYIPTGASAGTRNPDYCVMDGISSFFTSQSSLTMLIDATPRFQSGFPALWRLTDAGNANSYELYYTSSGTNNTYATKVAVGGVSSGESNFANSIAQNTRQIMGYAIASGVGFRSRNGVSASAQIPTSLPSAALTRLGIGSSGLSANPSTAHIRRIKYWPYAMTQDQLNGVTTP